ncbi:polyadenylate-binding protein 3 [Heracleum sosnowskyi]|uniref:Polyadenylate-binding protein 3 n=1 Tax=Heracleum sosnowskyi TaxID=360622 RepID=A0AAD8I5J3_9APIA|nr:polyadenylate-binding protein 3 [Heracleum sosnowskyi]
MVTSLVSSPPTSISITHKLDFIYNSRISTKFIKNNYSPLLKNQTLFYSTTTSCSSKVNAASTTLDYNTYSSSSSTHQHHWIVVMDTPPKLLHSRPQIIDFYVKTILTVLGSQKYAEMCIYDASCETHFGFCCDVDEEMAREIACLPGVLSVRPDPDFHIIRKDSSYYKVQQNAPSISSNESSWLLPLNNLKHWVVRTEKPLVGVMEKPQVVDYYVQILSKVLGNEKDAQMCMYDVFWQSNFGFFSVLDDVCAQELAGVPGVLSVQPDEKWDSANKDSGGENTLQSSNSADSSAAAQTISIGTKKLFVTGLSFYTSEKTLRAAFEGFGELVEVKIIMDKISKRSRGYAFIEYTTEAAASTALKEMNGKIINGWMIVVDVAKKNPPKYSTDQRSSI